MQVKVIYDGSLSSANRNLSQPFTGGQYLYFDPSLEEGIALQIGVAWLIKLPGINGDLIKVWESSSVLDTDYVIPIPREISESGYELYCGFGTSIDEQNFRAYVIYSDVTQETLAADLEQVKSDLADILQNQTTQFALDTAIGVNQLAQNQAISLIGTGLIPITGGITSPVPLLLTGSSLLPLLPP